MSEVTAPTALPHLVWVYPDSFSERLDIATWLETTRELRNLGWQVTLIGGGQEGHQQLLGVDVVCISRPPIYLLRQIVFHLGLLYWLIREWGSIDFILFHQLSAPWLLPLHIMRGLTGRPRPLLVMDTRTVPMEDPARASFRDRLRGWFHQAMGHLAQYWADGQTAITQRMADTVHIPSAQLWGTWPSGANPDEFRSARTRRHWPQDLDTIHLTYVGILSHERNLLTLSQAVMRANAHNMRFYLSLIGDGSARDALEEHARQTQGRICVVPSVPHDQIPEYLGLAHIGVLPFPDEEKYRVSSPIKLFEYMAAGLPILATRIACHTDVLNNQQCVIWAETADEEGLFKALQSAWNGRMFLAKMGQEASAAAQGWTWRASAEKLGAALQRGLVQSKRRTKQKDLSAS